MILWYINEISDLWRKESNTQNVWAWSERCLSLRFFYFLWYKTNGHGRAYYRHTLGYIKWRASKEEFNCKLREGGFEL